MLGRKHMPQCCIDRPIFTSFGDVPFSIGHSSQYPHGLPPTHQNFAKTNIHPMIAYIKGVVGELSPTEAVIEAAGVGYQLAISLNTFAALQGKETAKVYVKEVIREDAHDLFGFFSKEERTLFEALTSVNGIGGATARMVLSAFTPAELAEVIQSEQTAMLKSVKGIGPKAAARIVLDLKDKIGTLLSNGTIDVAPSAGGGIATADKERAEEAISALSTLGFQPAAVRKVVAAILKEEPGLDVQQIIKRGLKEIK